MCDYSYNCKKYKDDKCNESEYCRRKFVLTKIFEMSNLPPVGLNPPEIWSDVDDAKFHELDDVRKNIVDFVNKGKSLYICSSNCGNGKTTWAYKLALQYISQMWYRTGIRPLVYFINVSDLLTMTKSSFELDGLAETIKEMKLRIQQSDLVIWDDFGVKTLSEFDRDMILDLIDYRISHNKSNIYTSNNLEGITETKYGDRLKSRVYNMSQKVVFKGKDRREINDTESST